MGIMSPRKQKEKLTGETGRDEGNDLKRFCADCKTTKTPLWRVGPSGPKSLCNACGIRYRKKRFAYSAVPFTRSSQRKRTGRNFHCIGGKGMVINGSSVGGTKGKSGGGDGNVGGRDNSGKTGWSESLRMRLMIMGSGFLLRTSFVKKHRCQRRRNFFSHEEKQAAFSLMALSCAPVSA